MPDSRLGKSLFPKATAAASSAHVRRWKLLEMELLKDVRLKLEVRDYHGFRFRLDSENSKYECSIKHVYGVCDSFFGEKIGLVAS